MNLNEEANCQEMLKFDTEKKKNWLKSILRDQDATILFTKKDGTEREMICTLSEDKIPSEKSPKNTGKAQNSEILAVFDVEKQDWRSFRWDSIKKVVFTIE